MSEAITITPGLRANRNVWSAALSQAKSESDSLLWANVCVNKGRRRSKEKQMRRLLETGSRVLAIALSTYTLRTEAQATVEGTAVEANPNRPTVTSPATLTPVGYLQFENGSLYASDSGEFSTRTGINQVTKLTVVPRLELLVQSEPFVHSTRSDNPGSHIGEVFAGAQGVVLSGHEGQPTIALSYIHRLHQSLAPEVDIGTFLQSALVLVSDDHCGFHIDANAVFSEQVQEPARRGQFGQTISVSHALGKATISGEVWHFSQPLIKGNAVGNLWAVSYQLKPNVVIDSGFDHGLTSTSTRWEAFAGFTYLLPHRLWKSHEAR